ncbi:hypothetical protein [Psychromonas sp. SP041]|uniref:hypothetical protein n=1 Tax=Psychromonas sp. SP041 TaxID=1365007 RepID=UPI0010C7D2A8|nr:hypothetical protein [Psychromonas sp. SP041]
MSKKNKSKSSANTTAKKKSNRLHEVLEMHYEGYRYKKKTTSHDNEMHRSFNKKLRSFLKDCDKKSFVPSKSFVEKEILKIKDEVQYEINMKGISLGTTDYRRIDSNLASMDFHSYLEKKKDSVTGESIKKLRILGLVPLARLTDGDIRLILRIFKEIADEQNEEGVILIDLMNVRVSSVVGDEEKFEICDMLLRKCRNLTKKHAKQNNQNTDFKYAFLDRARDILVNASI